VKRVATFQGYCTFTDKDGDKALMRWQCRNPEVGVSRCEGDFQWMGGSGKYTGLTGDNALNSGGVPKTAAGWAVWEGGVASTGLGRRDLGVAECDRSGD
jgi:hypothetical protein